MPLVLRSSLEHRVIAYASAHYPLTAGELAAALHVSDQRLMVELRRMEGKGLVELDILPDKVFVRLLVLEADPREADVNSDDGPGPEEGKGKGGKGGDDPAYR